MKISLHIWGGRFNFLRPLTKKGPNLETPIVKQLIYMLDMSAFPQLAMSSVLTSRNQADGETKARGTAMRQTRKSGLDPKVQSVSQHSLGVDRYG